MLKKKGRGNPRRQPTREEVKATVRDQLLQNIENGQDRATRSIELLGKMKEHDFFVRSADVQIGVFAHLASEQADPETERLLASKRKKARLRHLRSRAMISHQQIDTILSVFSADDVAALYPATTAEAGLESMQQMLERQAQIRAAKADVKAARRAQR